MVEVLASAVESELALLKVEEVGVGVHPSEACEPGLGVAPEALDPVDVVAADGAAAELVGRVVDAQVLPVAR